MDGVSFTRSQVPSFFRTTTTGPSVNTDLDGSAFSAMKVRIPLIWSQNVRLTALCETENLWKRGERTLNYKETIRERQRVLSFVIKGTHEVRVLGSFTKEAKSIHAHK